MRFALLLLTIVHFMAVSQEVKELNFPKPLYLTTEGKAAWITHPDINLTDYNVVIFRKTLELASKPDSFIVHLSADNHYELFINGKFVCSGPARDDNMHWRYETIDIAPFLKPGKNVIAAQVCNWGLEKIKAQFSYGTAFLLQGHGEREKAIHSDDKTWKVYWNKAYTINKVLWMYQQEIVNGWYAGNPCDSIDGSLYPWGWKEERFDDSNWKKAKWQSSVANRYTGQHADWLLVPRPIQLLEQKNERFASISSAEGVNIKEVLFDGKSKLTIPANTKVRILIDHKVITIGYPQLIVSGGNGSTIKALYAESFFNNDNTKSNRNKFKGQKLVGYDDVYFPEGGEKRLYTTTWQRPFRFIELTITTKDKPLVIDDYYNIAVSYPASLTATFESSIPMLKKIWDVAWRTDKICAQDMLMSDAYYETMQYIYDTRIHALVLYHMSGNDDLYRQAIEQFDHSRISDGISLASYPNDWYWILPSFTLAYLNMIHDYAWISGDKAYVNERLNGIRSVINWFDSRTDANGLIGNLPWANPHEALIHSANLSSHYALTLQNMAFLMEFIGNPEEGKRYRAKGEQMAATVYKLCFNKEKGVLQQSPVDTKIIGITNAMAVLAGVFPKDKELEVVNKIFDKYGVGYPEQFYAFQALKKVSLGDRFTNLLNLWSAPIDSGLSTFPEIPGNMPRSDCHPWSTCPPYAYFDIVCGIQPIEPGYGKVKIAPVLGSLTFVKASWPLKPGVIEVDLKRTGKKGIEGSVTLPASVSGEFIWEGKTISLKGGKQNIKLD